MRLYGENQYPGPMGPRSETRPCGLYESMMQRVCPYTLRGFLYIGGEKQDDHRPYRYYSLLSALIRQWRGDWKDDTLPFLMLVQLPDVPKMKGGARLPELAIYSRGTDACVRHVQAYRDSRCILG